MRTESGARFYFLGNRGEKKKRGQCQPHTCDIHVSSTAFGNLDRLPLEQIEQPNQSPRQSPPGSTAVLNLPILANRSAQAGKKCWHKYAPWPQRVAPTPESRQRAYRGHPTSISIIIYASSFVHFEYLARWLPPFSIISFL